MPAGRRGVSLMKIEPPRPPLEDAAEAPPPPAWVEVLIWMDAVIHESSPDSEKTTRRVERHLENRHDGPDYLCVHLG